MDLFEKVKATASVVGESAGEFMKKAGQKTNETIEIAKISARNAELDREIGILFQDIGRYVYNRYKGTETEEGVTERLIQQIEERICAIEENKGRISVIKNFVLCPRCNEKMDKTGVFCPNCGEKIS